MFNFKSQDDEKKALKTMSNICPFNEEDDFADDDFNLDEDEADSGWFFECKMCKGAQCTGYIRK